jgi:peptidoglycan/LPS O-acetylase OafA/YrhL
MILIKSSLSKRIPELDGIRAMAKLLILFFHYINNQLPESSNIFLRLLQRITSLGWSGFDLFFVLSGFLIGGILIRNK